MVRVFGNVITEHVSASETDYSNAIQAMLDGKAKERKYDTIASAISYRGDEDPHYAAEAEALFCWRSLVWRYANGELGKVLAGEREQPHIAEFIQEVVENVPFEWPDVQAKPSQQ